MYVYIHILFDKNSNKKHDAHPNSNTTVKIFTVIIDKMILCFHLLPTKLFP